MLELFARMNEATPLGYQLAFLIRVLVATLCGGAVGYERTKRLKEAGIRTHCLVCCASALIMIVSKYAFADLSVDGLFFPGDRGADPARIAAQVVSGIGFIGAGVIFFEHDSVRGLTTASAIWVAAAVGMSCGAGMIAVAALIVLLYFLAILAVAPIARRLIRRGTEGRLRITYVDGKGVLRALLLKASEMDFESMVTASRQITRMEWRGAVIDMRVDGRKGISDLVSALSMVDGVVEVEVLDDER